MAIDFTEQGTTSKTFVLIMCCISSSMAAKNFSLSSDFMASLWVRTFGFASVLAEKQDGSIH
eukprot:7450674-Ditylum_brightwellii.AAC.1